MVLFTALCNPLIAQKMKNELTKRQQSIVPIAAFTAKGDMENLRVALNEGLDNGLTVNEIKEILTHLYAYVGFPRSLNGIVQFMTVTQERAEKGIVDNQGNESTPMPINNNSLELGTKVQTRLSGAPVVGGVMAFAPAIDYYLKAHLFGDIFSRTDISESDRELATLATLASLEGVESQLKSHLRIAANAGLTEDQIWSIISLLQEKVSAQAAYQAGKVMSKAYDRPLSIEIPIEDVFPRGKVATINYFSGTVYVQPIVSSDTTVKCQISNVTFSAGARTRWHKHSGTQILLCSAGTGWYQEQGQSARKLQMGDRVVINPGVIHWHGASAVSEFSHLSVIPNPESNQDTWLEAVSEKDYNQANQ